MARFSALLLLLAATWTGCAGDNAMTSSGSPGAPQPALRCTTPTDTSATLGSPFNLHFGGQAAIVGEDLSLTFAPGLHHCIGHLLAKLQLSEFFAALTQRFDRVEILQEPEFVPNLVFRGVTRLNVRFHPRAG